MPKSSLEIVSPKSMSLKFWLKAPMLVFVNLAAMTSSISELFSKVAGCIIKDSESSSDYWWLLMCVPVLVFTATRTLVYVNFGIKYYEQMVVMPIYNTCLLNHNILIGLLSLNEIKHYSYFQLAGILFSTLTCSLGISVFLEKNKEKGKSLS